MYKKRSLRATGASILLANLLCVPLGAADVAPFVIPSPRANAMGGTHAALADDFSALFTNPAGFVSAREQLNIAQLTFEAYGPLFDLADATSTYLKDGELNLSGLVGERGMKTGLDMAGPLSFGWVGRGLGFGFFNRSKLAADASGTGIEAVVSEDLMLVGGYAFRFNPRDGDFLDLGFLAKGMLRGTSLSEASILTVTDLFEDFSLSTAPFTLTAGVGLDVGLRYEYRKTLAGAIVCRDLYSPVSVTDYASVDAFLNGSDPGEATTSSKTIDRQWDLGFLYTPHLPVFERYLSGVVIAVDYRDVFGMFDLIPRNPILNLGVGAEVVFLDVLSLRAGIGDALPSLGFGLDMRFMQLDFTMRGIEFGLDPGYDPVFAMDLGLLFRY
jgi:hypothetical protein